MPFHSTSTRPDGHPKTTWVRFHIAYSEKHAHTGPSRDADATKAALPDLSSLEVLRRLQAHPKDHAILEEVASRLESPEHQVWMRNAMVDLFGSTHETNVWKNCIDEQVCHPVSILKPTTLEELVQAVKTGREKRLHVRAVGSGHSFSDVAPTDGILLDPHGMNKELPVEADSLKDPASAPSLIAVESGITIEALKTLLDKQGRALANMGAYDGQTLAGAISTGTHGTGITLGPLASLVRAITIVVSTGEVVQLEPTNGITDPQKFDSSKGVQLRQDDAWFNTALVSFGCTGIIYSYVVSVVKSFYLKEVRTLSSWESLKSGLSAGAGSQVLTSHRGYEIDINPYAVDGKHSAIQVIHDDAPTATASVGSRGIRSWLGGVLASLPWIQNILVWYLNTFPRQSPGIINSALETLETPDPTTGYVDKSFEVMNIGAVDNVRAYALELSLPADDGPRLVASIDRLLAFLGDQAKTKKWYMAGPVALRFVAASEAFVAPQYGRPTCMVELDMLVGIESGKDLLKAVKKEMCTPGSGVRVHWGLDLDTVTGMDAKEWYPRWDEWVAAYEEMNGGGLFDNAATDRLGISVGFNK